MNLESNSKLESEVQKLLKDPAIRNSSIVTMCMTDEADDENASNPVSQILALQRFTSNEFIKTHGSLASIYAQLKENRADIIETIKVYGNGGGSSLSGVAGTAASLGSLIPEPYIASTTAALSFVALGKDEKHKELQQEALQIPREQRTIEQQLRLDTNSDEEYVKAARKLGLFLYEQHMGAEDFQGAPMSNEELLELWKKHEDPIQFPKRVDASEVYPYIDPNTFRFIVRPEDLKRPAELEQTKSATLTRNPLTGAEVSTVDGGVVGIGCADDSRTNLLYRQKLYEQALGRSAATVSSALKGACAASTATMKLPQNSMAALNPAFPSLAGALNPPKENSGPWIPRSSLKTHAEVAAELDGGYGYRHRYVRHLSDDGSGPDPSLIRDLAQSAARNFARFQKTPEIHFHIEKVEVKAEQSMVNDRIDMDKLMEAVYAQLTDSLTRAVTTRPAKDYWK